MASAVRMVSAQAATPIETAMISVAMPFSLRRTASSTAISSNGFIDIFTPVGFDPGAVRADADLDVVIDDPLHGHEKFHEEDGFLEFVAHRCFRRRAGLVHGETKNVIQPAAHLFRAFKIRHD